MSLPAVLAARANCCPSSTSNPSPAKCASCNVTEVETVKCAHSGAKHNRRHFVRAASIRSCRYFSTTNSKSPSNPPPALSKNSKLSFITNPARKRFSCSRMHAGPDTLHATRPNTSRFACFALGASNVCLVGEARRAPSRHCRDARIYCRSCMA